ncbi:MAG TPA: polymer-forming cytoskeletal protein [Actinomycetota bacterium]
MREGTSSEVTVLGNGARLEGTVVSAGSLRIDGQVKGKISADGDVVLSPGCQVEADISAQNVTIGGPFRGNIMSKGRTELAKGGRVDGDITCKSLVVAEGAIFCGQSIMDQQAGQAHAAAQGRGSEVKATARSEGGDSVTVLEGERARAR